jgi:site-specific DNA recombinase
MRPTLAGRIEFDGELIGRLPGEPLIEERKWLRLRAMINGRRRGRPSTNRYLGSGIIRCGRCGKPMGADQSFMGEGIPNRSIYRCNRQRAGCGLTIDLAGTDEELRALTIARLSDARYAQAVSAARARVSDRLAELNVEIREIEKLQGQLSERVGRREMKYADFEKSYDFLQRDLEPLLKERDALSGGPTGDGPVQAMSSEEIAREWDGTEDVAARRAMLRDAIGPDHVRILPAVRRKVDPNRVILVSPETPLAEQDSWPEMRPSIDCD